MKKMWKKSICCLLIAAVMLSGIVYSPVAKKEIVAAEEEAPVVYKEIRTVSELYAIRNDLRGSYRLMNDIDLSGQEWVPIEGFEGTLDGNGYRIKGMTIKGEMEKATGLFESVYYGVIMNLGMCDVNIDIKVSEDVIGRFGCGAIVGDIDYSTIMNCFVSGKIQLKNNKNERCVGYVGGLVGQAEEATIKDCYNTASVQCICDEDSLCECDRCVGGVVGGGDSRLQNCYNYGSINNGKGMAIENGDEHENCVYLKESGIGSTEGDTPLSDTQMRDANYFTNFDFRDVWEVDPDSSYPYPQLKSCMQVRVQNVVLEQIPSQTQYNQGDGLNLEGGRLLVTYEDGRTSSSAITDLMVSGYNMSQIGTQDVIVRRGNMTVSYPIVVNPIPVTGINLSAVSLSMQRGAEKYLRASIVPSNATDQSITWSTDNSNVVTVDQNGKVKALRNGSANVTVTAANGVTATCRVLVGVEEKKNSNARIKLGRVSISSIRVSGKKLIMRWKKISGASGYHIQIAKNRKFTKGKKNYNASGSQVGGYIAGKKKTTYYIRMRAYAYDDGDKVYGKYSAIKKKRIK